MLEYHRFKTVNDLFMKGKTEEARLELTELQRRYVTLCDENTTLKIQIQEYEDILYLSRNLIQDGTFYWLITGSIKQGPFCPSCYDREGLLVRLSGEHRERFCSCCRESFVALPEQAKVAPLDLEQREPYVPAMVGSQHKTKVIPFGK